MPMRLFSQIKKEPESIKWGSDILSGVIVALVSIPISMGYAQIAGLPAVYGLYGSLLPILVFGLLTTSRQFVVGVDAMPAAMVGGFLAEMGIAAESDDALHLVPAIAICVALWFGVFYLFKAGRIVKYISTPVMGGFILGVGMTIILMQLPKLFGGDPGTGEVADLMGNIWRELADFHLLSFSLGLGTVIIILAGKKVIPRVPMTVVMLVIGALLQYFIGLDKYGVKIMAPVEAGLPKPVWPDPFAGGVSIQDLVVDSFGIAGVIMAQTLLASGKYAAKYGHPIDNNAELLAYGAMNLASAGVGCCPVNDSVSRSGIADNTGTTSQIMSITASACMLAILLFASPLIKYLPVPVLSGIVTTALIGILDIKLAVRTWKCVRREFVIFMMAFLGVLFFGTLYGVMIGVMLSFWEVAIRGVKPPTAFMGRMKDHGNFYTLDRHPSARPIKNTVIYRFGGNLFFANIDMFCREIEESILPGTKIVVVDGRGIGSIDITAADRLVIFNKKLRERGIRFYLTEHDGSLNDQLQKLGAGSLLEAGVVRRTITLALKDAGLEKPYDLDEDEEHRQKMLIHAGETADHREARAEKEWLFGKNEKTDTHRRKQ